jgi:predicted alpha/beta superfamily hydrolase
MRDWQRVPPENNREVFQVDVPAIGDRLEITVVPPLFRDPTSPRRLPAIYVLDPFPTIDIFAGIKLHFDIFSGGVIPPAYVIGIGYANRDIQARRFRDFTPTKAALPPELPIDLTFGTGGASRYLDCIRNIVIPGLESAYPLDPAERMLIGYSLGGLFVSHVLFEHPETFARYLVISPSLWWDEDAIYREEEAWAKEHRDLPAKVALVGGAGEESAGGGWHNNLSEEVMRKLQLVTHLRTLHDRLAARHYPGLRLSLRLTPEGRHITHFPNAISLGLIDAFGL